MDRGQGGESTTKTRNEKDNTVYNSETKLVTTERLPYIIYSTDWHFCFEPHLVSHVLTALPGDCSEVG